ncbi:MAG: winged helix-turn-helix transcriptional regulator [Catenulispora sp.]|nr:winged helix-turn-helix transcriptional regulator [Catenulispora sp.]
MATRSSKSPLAPAPPPEALAEHLRSAVKALVRNARTGDRLPPIPAAVLDLLDTGQAMTTADLAASRGVRHQTMAATVKDLADTGLIASGPDPDDARKKILTLTPAGKETLNAHRRQRVAALADAVAATLDEDDRRILARALDLIDRVGEAMAS